MRTIYYSFIAMLLTIAVSCSKKDMNVPGNATKPAIQATALPSAKTDGWYEVKLTGTVRDSVGLKSVRIKCAAFSLDWDIRMTTDPATKVYTIDRVVKAPLSVRNDANIIEVTAENIYGLTTVTKLAVNDIEAPAFKDALTDFIVEIKNNIAPLNIAFTAQDNKALKSVVVSCPALSLNDTTAVSGVSYNYNKTLQLPLKKGSFPMTITLVDSSGLKTQTSVSVRVSRIVPYAGDIALYMTPLNSQNDFTRYISGMPCVIDRKGDYLYEARYYSPAAGTKLFFLGQRAFAGYRFGQDPLGDNGTLTSNDAASLPIELPGKGYYKITLDTKAETYKVEAYTPPATDLWTLPNNPLGMTGAYFDDYPGASRPKEAVQCIQDASNPYLYKTRVKMHKLVSFTLTPTDKVNDKFLSPFWRYDYTLDGKLIQGSTGKNTSYTFANSTAVYWVIITFDLHLQTCTVENDGLAQ